MAKFGPRFSASADDDPKLDPKLTGEELVQQIRSAVNMEWEAVRLYTWIAESTDDALAAEVLRGVADEERVHASEFLHLLRALAPDEAELWAEGEKEVEEKKTAVDYGAVAKRAAGELHAPAAPGRAKTARDLLGRAEEAIENDEDFIYDVAADAGQMVGNVKHMRWFLHAVANWLIEDAEEWSHLPLFD
jgi:rubrerythrin